MILAIGGLAQAAEYRAFWVDAWGAGIRNQAEVEQLLGRVGSATIQGRIREANCNAVIIQVRRRADVCYPSALGEPYFSGLSPANFNALQAAIDAAHDTTGGKKRIEVHAWIVTFATASSSGVSPVYYAHNDPADPENYWVTLDNNGAETSDKAFDPGHPRCLQYLTDVCMDLVRNFDIDGIHYDYIRFTGNNQGYNPTSIARYNARYGLSGQPLPGDERFKQWRRDQVTALVRKVYANIQATKPWVRQSGAFVTWNPSPTASTREAFQATRPYYDVYSDWDSWIQEGIVDMAVPMTYYNWASLPNDYLRWMNWEKDRKGNRHMIIGPGIYLNSLSNAILELQMTRDPSPAGNYAHGFAGYSYRTPYSGGTWDGFKPSLVANVTPTWDDVPPMPWKTNPTTGHIMGTVTAASTGAWADGATVTAAGPVTRTMTCDGTGFYAFIDLPPGTYTVTASQAGLGTAQAPVTVAIGQVTGNMYVQDFALGAGGPPVISNVQATAITNVGATITWNTDTPASSQVEYGTSAAYGNLTPLDPANVTSHSVGLAGLQPGTLYHYRVISTNANGTSVSNDYTFTTGGPPSISNVQAVNVGSHSATITWTTNVPADSQVRYGTTPAYGSQTPVDPAAVTSHSVTLTGLVPATTYHYQVVSTNAYGSAASADFTFATAPFVVEIVVDNSDPGWSNTSPSGNWTTGSNPAVPRIGADYLYTSGTGDPSEASATRRCRWTPTIQQAGPYDVYVYYQIGSNRTTGAPYKVVYSGGSLVSVQNQYSSTPNQGGWFLIGSDLPFDVGTAGYVELSNNTPDTRYVSADAAKFVFKGDSEPPTAPTGLTATAVSSDSIELSWTPATDNLGVAGYRIYRNGTATATATGTSYLDSGLAPNTPYSYEVAAYDGAGNEGLRSEAALRHTLSVPPSPATVTCNRAVDTWQSEDGFTFTAVGGFGPGTVARYLTAWTQDPTHEWGSGGESLWNAGTLTRYAVTPGTSWYLHLAGLNEEDRPNGTLALGPYRFQPLPGLAGGPDPADGATGVSTTAVLTWTAGTHAASHDVYFGTTQPGTFRGNQAGTTFDPGPLAPNTTYYWRIDEVNAAGTTTGTVWSFTTAREPFLAADFDSDGDIDLSDFAVFQYCFNGPNQPPRDAGCDGADFDHDHDVDLADFGAFQACYNGPDRPPACIP